MEQAFSFYAGLAAALGFMAAAVLFAARGKRSWPNALFSLALLLTGFWALTVALANSGYPTWDRLRPTFGALRDAGWFAATIGLLRQESERQSLWRQLAVVAGLIILADLGFALSGAAFNTGLGLRIGLSAIQLAVSVMGLILIENLVLNLSSPRRWSVRLMAIGLTALFSYNIVLRIPEFLGSESIEGFVAAQPLVYLLALPLFVVTGVRNNSLKLQVHSSRNVAFHSATLIFAGILLQGTAVAAYYVRSFGGAPATALSIVLVFAGILTVIVALSSRMVRTQIRTFINENFYSYKYDYRLEWTKFIQALSQYQEQGAPERALRTLADLLDSPGGVLWVRRQGWRQYMPLASWSFGETFGPIDADDALLADLRDEKIAFLDFTTREEDALTVTWRERFPGAWIAVPLHFRGELIGFALLRKQGLARRLDWEDRNLVSLIAMQLALYLVHEQIAQELADSQQLVEFNNRVAFALHDLKNTIGQLNLVLHNATRFGDDARFRADMLATIRQAVDNLQTLMGKLRNEPVAEAARMPETRVDVCGLLERFAEQKSSRGVVFGRADGPIFAEIAKPDEFQGALEHVLSNALEASPAGSNVRLSVDRQNGRIRVRVEDRGPGMSADFVAQELFRPLHTTKKKGLGIGAYQARAIMRNLGGDMEVQSTLGEGTIVSLFLPASADAERGAASS
ncbi:MAG TPA: XrtA/PEP-CTERM system histidine kinase PrsK [Rhizomicrobium sp.]|nr:XrtA/PEP-CTERM system histidine kinase PrsK [Rhizomicrobium sp.]